MNWTATVRGDPRTLPNGQVESSVLFESDSDDTLNFQQSFVYPAGDQATLETFCRTRIADRNAELDGTAPAVDDGTILALGAPKTGPAVVVGLPIAVDPAQQKRTDFDLADARYAALLDDVRKGYLKPDDPIVLQAQKEASAFYDVTFRDI